MSAPIGDVEIVARKAWLLLDAAGEADNAVVGIPRATLLRWACEAVALCEAWKHGSYPDDLAAAALLLCEAIGTDEADSLEEWG